MEQEKENRWTKEGVGKAIRLILIGKNMDSAKIIVGNPTKEEKERVAKLVESYGHRAEIGDGDYVRVFAALGN